MRGRTQVPNELSASEAARAIAARDISCEDLLRACLARIEKRESALRAWVTIDWEGALAEARACDNGPVRGPLHGVPFGVKDVLDTADLPTEMGSPIYKGHRPVADASCVMALRAAGAIVLGKTVTCEFAGVTPGATRNPLDLERTPGGSSSGSGAAVADMMVPIALGTQTGGSVLRPASFCGVVGFKPTYGEICRAGLKLAAESLDTIGVIARTPEDVGLVSDVLTGRPVSVALDFNAPPKIGLCRTYLWDEKASAETRASVERAAEIARAAGADIVDVDLPPDFARLAKIREIVNDVERARSLAWEWAYRRDALSPAMQTIVARGLQISHDIYVAELRSAERLRAEFDAIAWEFDGFIAPCVNGEAPVGLDYAGDPSLQSLWTILHAPTVSLPALRGPNRMPVGVQLVGPRWSDRKLIALAIWLRKAGLGQGTS